MPRLRLISATLCLATICASALTAQSSCGAGWTNGFSAIAGADGQVNAFATFDDGSGLATYAGGNFTAIGGTQAASVARLYASGWSPVGAGFTGPFGATVSALAVYGTGSAAALYAGGSFSTSGTNTVNSIATWNGLTWVSLGTGVNGQVKALCVFNAGAGPELYAGGLFTAAGGLTSVNVAKWNGSAWLAVGGGAVSGVTTTGAIVQSLTVHDDGTGPALYAGIYAPFATTSALWKLVGNAWTAVSTMPGGSVVSGMVSFGGALYIGGTFTSIGGVPVSATARLDSTGWSSLGSGMSGAVNSLVVHDDGSGPAVYAGGGFPLAGGVVAWGAAKWSGTAWSALGLGMYGTVTTLHPTTIAGSPALIAGGSFFTAGGLGARNVAIWQSGAWQTPAPGISGGVSALTVWDDGSGPGLYAAGAFTTIGGVAANGVARWNGATWSPLGSGLTSTTGLANQPPVPPSIRALGSYDDGTGSALYCAGNFSFAGGVTANRIAKWNGSAWSPLGSGLDGMAFSLVSWNDGTGPALYAGGAFGTAGGVPINGLARWNGTTWSNVGSGIPSPGNLSALAVFNDGTGARLYAGGSFNAGPGMQNLAAWNGTIWAPVGAGFNGNGIIHALAVHDDGSGPALYVGYALGVLRWNGAAWSQPGIPLATGDVYALAEFNESGTRRLYAASHNGPGGSVFRWDGVTWSNVGTTTGSATSLAIIGAPSALAAYTTPTSHALYSGGDFLTVGGVYSPSIAALSAALPAITSQPSSQTVAYGSPVTFAAVASSPLLTWQWRKNGVPIPGATNANLVIAAAQFSDAGPYDAIASAGACTATTQGAVLSVRGCTLTLTQPAGPGSIGIVNSAGPAGANYFSAFSFDPFNATSPGNGPWLGLHIQFTDLVNQFYLQAPPFVGTLSAGGSSSFSLGAGAISASLAGFTAAGVTAIYTPATLTVDGSSTVATLVLQ